MGNAIDMINDFCMPYSQRSNQYIEGNKILSPNNKGRKKISFKSILNLFNSPAPALSLRFFR